MELIYGISLVVGGVYLILTLLGNLGEGLDFGVDSALDAVGLDHVFGIGEADVTGFGCSVLAIFLTVFGAMGTIGTMAGWSPLLMIVLSIALGIVISRAAGAVLRFAYAGQYTDVRSVDTLIGAKARVTIDTPAGQTGEVIVEQNEVQKFPVIEVDSTPLKRGDQVEIIAVSGRYLNVRKLTLSD